MYLRVLINLLPDATNYFSPLVQTFAIFSLIYASFSTIIQQDTKRLIAYSSVAHMAVVVLGLSLIGIWQINPIIAALGATGIVLSACYSIFLYNRVSFGNYSPYLPPLLDINRREFYLLISLLIPTVIFGIFPNIILESLHTSVSALLFQLPN